MSSGHFILRPPYVVEFFTDRRGKWRWRLRAENRLILATSEAYERRGMCQRTGKRVADTLGVKTHEVNR